ncbi:hypothetical protein NM688_g1261 [Phlebia brevispora]|uniref:Uncharacterized protein n=1 Tax=Phlebia brevispora TaxID=194682 RepID=A0ACC1TC62_9APHY|nr:hypothetical protein NM688_g1261 [Phlebia brevispora]
MKSLTHVLADSNDLCDKAPKAAVGSECQTWTPNAALVLDVRQRKQLNYANDARTSLSSSQNLIPPHQYALRGASRQQATACPGAARSSRHAEHMYITPQREVNELKHACARVSARHSTRVDKTYDKTETCQTRSQGVSCVPTESTQPLSGTTLAGTISGGETDGPVARSLSPSFKSTPLPIDVVLNASDFEAKAIIGKGAFGRVYLVADKVTKQEYALKLIDKENLPGILYGGIFEERRVGSSLRGSRWALTVEASFHDHIFFYILTKYCPGRGLDYQTRHCNPSKAITKKMMAELVLAVEDLHSRRIIHGDIKLENVLMDENCHLLLADFGHARAFGVAESERPWKKYSIWKPSQDDRTKITHKTESGDFTDPLTGTPGYIAPENWTSDRVSYPADVWCMGIVFHVLFYGQYPFGMEPWRHSEEELQYATLHEELEFRSYDFDQHVANLMSRMLEKDPSKRITVAEIKRHPYFNSIDWKRVAERPPAINPIPSLTKEGRELERVVIPSNESDRYNCGGDLFPWFSYTSPELAQARRHALEKVEKDSRSDSRRRQGSFDAFEKVNNWMKHATIDKVRTRPAGEPRMLLD